MLHKKPSQSSLRGVFVYSAQIMTHFYLRLNPKTRLFCIFLGKDCSKNGSICPAEAPKNAPQGQKPLNLPRAGPKDCTQGQKPLNLPRGGPKNCTPGAKTAQFAPRRPQRLRPRGNARPGYVWRRCLRAQKFGDRVAASLLPSCWNRCESSVEWTVRETFCTRHHSQLSFSLDPRKPLYGQSRRLRLPPQPRRPADPR